MNQIKERGMLKAFSNGEYVFSETKEDNEFLFYRDDRQILGKVRKKVIENLYNNYRDMKMVSGEPVEIAMNNANLPLLMMG